MILLLFLLSHPVEARYNSSLFWSYYGGQPLETGGYSRHSPKSWEGNGLLSPHLTTENEVEQDPAVLVLGSLTRISHGPRRRREVFQVYDLPEIKTGGQANQIEAFRSFLSKWPVKRPEGSSSGRSGVDYHQIYDEHYRKFQQTKRGSRPSKAWCRHSCTPGGARASGAPCCSRDSQPLSIGPLVQPSLLENWVTGVFEFAANNPVIFTFIKSLVLVGTMGVAALLWGLLGETVGVLELPRARHFNSPAEFQEKERFVLEVVGGNWLAALEEHVRRREDKVLGPYFYCCVSPDSERLECVPHRTRAVSSQPSLQCGSQYKYDISLSRTRLTESSNVL